VTVVAFIILCVASSFSGCSRFYDRSRLDGPNIILISIDALRADHLGCYGYSRNTSPNIDSFTKRNILFKNCYVHEPWTLPSHISMLTSLYTITHGVDKEHALNPVIVTLAEVLEKEGYMTLGFVSAGTWTNAKYGFDQGFKIYHGGKRGESGEAKNTLIREYLEKYKEEKLFLFVHYFDVHSDFNQLPYDAPSPFNNLFSNGYSGNFQGGDNGVFASKYLKQVNKNQIKLKEDDLNYIASLYDNGIAYMDKCIGDLFEMLKSMDLFENSLIIVTSDHGEEFQEHGYMLHSNPFYYEEMMHVPLIVKLPKADSKEGKIINNLVESIDIMPTIIDLLEVEKPKIQGESLAGLINGGGKGKEYIFGFGSTGSLFIRSDRWKMVNDNGLQEGRFKLFDLHNDPTEHTNLIGKGLEVENKLKRKLSERIEMSMKLRKDLLSQDGERDDKDVSLTQEEKEKLRALGYLE
jgi:choline-sulfatase